MGQKPNGYGDAQRQYGGKCDRFYPVARDWIVSNRANFPTKTRPDENEVEAFAHLFVAFLTTSYKITPAQNRNPQAGS